MGEGGELPSCTMASTNSSANEFCVCKLSFSFNQAILPWSRRLMLQIECNPEVRFSSEETPLYVPSREVLLRGSKLYLCTSCENYVNKICPALTLSPRRALKKSRKDETKEQISPLASTVENKLTGSSESKVSKARKRPAKFLPKKKGTKKVKQSLMSVEPCN